MTPKDENRLHISWILFVWSTQNKWT